MKMLGYLFLAKLIIFGLTSCGYEETDHPEEGDYRGNSISMEAILEKVEAQTMILVEWDGVENLPGYPEGDGREIEMTFLPEGRFAAQGPINRIAGAFQIRENGYLEFQENMISTKMAGPPALMDLENKFMAALSEVREITLDVDSVVLVTEHHKSLRFMPKGPSGE